MHDATMQKLFINDLPLSRFLLRLKLKTTNPKNLKHRNYYI